MDGLLKLGIDPWAILTYVVNTGVLLAVLTYVLYKPLMKFLDARRDQIAASVDEARLLKEQLDAKSAEAQHAQAKFEVELKKETDNLRKFLDDRRAQLETEMSAARTEMMQKAQADIDSKKEEMIKEIEVTLLDLMKKIILDIVQHKVPEDVVQASIKDSWKTYRK